MPDAIGASEIDKQCDGDEHVAEEGREDGGTHDGMKALDVEDVHGGGESEATGGEHDSAENVEADPDTPGELITEIGNGTDAFDETQDGGVAAKYHHCVEDELPESEFELHFAPPLCSFDSASATSSRRWVIHQTPPRNIPPSGTKSGMRERTR